ncbi:arylamine N-acetyltransferase family protein [Kitasatospora sp. HPMI-4]|uniref:arylamine N-acetyltransferase family protein n=1 Tax=Kitasatospora sp. HPMI-4 TaxID=3448443 RepID=UPI003F1D0587
MLNRTVIDQYLRRLGLPEPGAPSVAALFALHRAHVEQVPYETLDIHLGRPTTIDPADSTARVLRGRGGYCFHLNGAFGTLLAALGFQVEWHIGGVQDRDPGAGAGASGDHLVLTVDCEGERWLVDVGLGDGLYEPLPLREGDYRQGPFRYRLAASKAEVGDWRFDHDPQGSLLGMDFLSGPARQADFEAKHRWLSTSPESPFARAVCAIRRDAEGVDALRGCMLVRLDAGGRHRHEITDPGEWYATLADRFGLALAEVGPAEREALWQRVYTVHQEWKEKVAEHA